MTKLILRIFAVILALGFTLEAQVTTSGINGTIQDASTKEALFGASVVAKHLPSGTVYGIATNTKGNFLLQGLRPGGPYEVVISYIGYQSVTLEGINLQLGESETLNIKLKEDAQVLTSVVVTGKKGSNINASRTGAATSFSRRAIENVATVSRSLFDIAKLSPQASVSSNGAISFAGANNRYNSFQVDGAATNDVFGLSSSGTNGGQTGANPVSLEAIDAIQVAIAPFDVRQSNFTGGAINVITKSGTNELHGSLYDYYSNQDFYGSTAGRDVKERKKLDTQYDNTLGFTLGGPIVKNKLFFFVNGEWQKASYPSRYGVGEGSDISAETAESVLNHLKTLTGGYDGGGYKSMDVPTENKKVLARMDWNINQAHRLTLRYSYLDAARLIYSPNARTLVFRDQAYTFKNKTHTFVAELNSRLSNTISNELRFTYNRIRDKRDTQGRPLPYISIRSGNANIRIGTERSSMANALDQDIFSFTDNFTINRGNHAITIGTQNELFSIRNLFIQNMYGNYDYSSVEDFLSVGTANPKLPRTYEYGFAVESITGDKLYSPNFKAAQLGLYIQDEWKASERLRLTYGLRVDLPLFFDKPRANEAFNNSAIAKAHGVANNVMPKTRPLFSPRIGFRYTLDETRQQVIRGGVGIFTGRIPFVWVYNNFSNTGIEFSRIRYSGRSFDQAPGFAFNIDPNKQYFAPQRNSTEVDMISSKFRFPQTLRATLAFETNLPGGIKATIEGMYNKNFNNIFYRNLNREATGQSFNHGALERPLYKQVSRDYTYLLLLENTNKGYSYSLATTLSKHFAFGLDASVSYTYGKSMAPIDGTSSVASSNWKYNYVFGDPNNPEMALTSFDVRHRIVGNLSYRVEYGKHFATTIGLIYNGQSGSRFSMSYNRSDLNGDGEDGNDLLYVPTDSELANMSFADSRTSTGEENKAAFKAFIEGEPQLRQYRGSYVPRNGLIAPFIHKFDLHIAQDFYVKVGGRRHTLQLNADIVNVGNLINRAWGIQRSVSYNVSPLSYNSSTGKYTFTPFNGGKMWTMQDINSRWHAQVGVKYIF